MDHDREAHWQSEWARAGLGLGRRDPQKEKFYALVAYPGASGFLHIGHLRGLTYADTLHRFHRMCGRSVFFPTGTHASGLPAVTFAQKVRERDPRTIAQLEERAVPREEWSKLEDPSYAARFLGKSYLAVFRELGLLIDETAYVTTIDEAYTAFIRWQFHRLDEAGVLIQAPHFASVCPVCGPVSVDPSETDLASGGNAEWILYTTVPFRLDDGRFLLAATLRPETVYGATNLWLPMAGELAVWHLGDHRFLVSPSAGRRLVEQHGGHVGATLPVGSLFDQVATAPITGARLPVLPSRLVNPSIGSGVVMSVPAHAPADWLAIQELSEHDRHRLADPPQIVDVDGATLTSSEKALLGGVGLHAERAARAAGARSLSDIAQVDEATERLYRLELLRGRMRRDLEGGVPVPEARRTVAERLASEGASPELREFSEPVVCRNGHEVVIQRVPDQWFIRYGDPAWKAKAHALASRMSILPDDYRRELPGILDWFADRPCTRRGRWLGTPFPKDESWLIEPIADSTFYPAYFPIHRFVARGEVPVSSLTDAFFDFVILGRGEGERTVRTALQEEARSEFLYWYPLDVNIGGKEHKRVHFPVFLQTHALLLPPELQPRGIFVHWWLTNPEGGKISKKEVAAKGRVPPMQDAFRQWGSDPLRLFYLQAASPSQDIEWEPALVDASAQRLADVERLLLLARAEGGGGGPPELERWLESRVHEIVAEARSCFSSFRFRDLAEAVYASLPMVVRRYLVRGGSAGPTLSRVAEAWIRLLSPMTPHLAEELGSGRFPGLVATAPYPDPGEFHHSPEALAAETLIDRVEEDLRNVLRPAVARGGAPDAAIFYVAAPWKSTVEAWIREGLVPGGGKVEIGPILERARAHPELAAHRSEVAPYVSRIAPLMRTEPAPPSTPTDDHAILRSAEAYLMRRFGFRNLSVYREEEAGPHDPKGRRGRARPGRPAFFLYGGLPKGTHHDPTPVNANGADGA